MLSILATFQTLFLHMVMFGFGFLVWTLGEYWVHNVLCHHRKMKWASKIHWNHHKMIGGIDKARLEAEEAYGKMTPLTIAAFAFPVAWLLFSLFLGFAFGFTFALAFVLSYLHYEYIHWRIHCRAPRNQYELKLLEHHFAHHYCDPKRYQSVSLPALDHFFGTLPSPEKQAQHFEKIKSRKPLNSDPNLWTWIHDLSSRYRSFPEDFHSPMAADVSNLNAQAH